MKWFLQEAVACCRWMLGETSLRTSRHCGRHLCLQLVYETQILPPGADGPKGKPGKEKTNCTVTLRETEELVREHEGSQSTLCWWWAPELRASRTKEAKGSRCCEG